MAPKFDLVIFDCDGVLVDSERVANEVFAQLLEHVLQRELEVGQVRKGTVGNITGCRFPNRIVVELDGFVPGESRVAIDLARLTAGVNLADGEPTDCSSGPAEVSCGEPFRALGIDFATGQQVGRQSVFSLQ